MQAQEITESLKDFIVTQLLEDDVEVELASDTPLFELKILDSLAVVTIVNFVSSTFNVNVPLEHLTAENLRSLDTMSTLIARLNAEAIAA